MRIQAAVVGLQGLFWLGCKHNVYTPPTRSFPLETPPTLKAGAFGVQAELSGHGKSPDVGAGTLRVKRGIEDNLEGSAEVTYAKAGNATAADTNPHLVAARAGVRLRPDELQSIGLTAGLGAGTFAGGPFLSFDVGATVAIYEGCTFTPFVSGSSYASTPISARVVDTTEAGEAVGTHVDTPEPTFGVQVKAGLAINFAACEKRDKSLLVGFGIEHFWDNDSDRGMATGGAAFQLDFD